MTPVFFLFLIISALLIIRERRIIRLIINLGIFSLISSACFLLLCAPDVALAEIVVSVFSTIVFVAAFEKYYNSAGRFTGARRPAPKESFIIPAVFIALVFALYVYFIPVDPYNPSLKELYLSSFAGEVGGENAVTAIYLGYRVYDTLFEALMLLVSIVAVIHLSRYEDLAASRGVPSGIQGSAFAQTTIQLISPMMIIICVYLVMNGHLTPGGGFHGGVVAASLFVCRFLIYDIYDIPVGKVITVEKLLFIGILLLATLFVFSGMSARFLALRIPYMVSMNLLIGLKVTCGFLIIFYRFTAFERV